MYIAAKNKNFELRFFKNRIKALKHVAQNNSIRIKDIKDTDIFAINQREGKTCIYGSFS